MEEVDINYNYTYTTTTILINNNICLTIEGDYNINLGILVHPDPESLISK
jgi:hypothetical protein